MLNSYTIFLKRGNQTALTMIPGPAPNSYWEEASESVLLDSKLVTQNIEKCHGDMCWLFVDPDKMHRLNSPLEEGLMKDLDMPVFNFTGNGSFDDLDVEQGRHRTFMLITSYGVDYLPTIVPASLAPKFRRLFGYKNGYLTLLKHQATQMLSVIKDGEAWYIGTSLERESVDSFKSMTDAKTALLSGNWKQLG